VKRIRFEYLIYLFLVIV